MKREEIFIRDPFILVKDGVYYLTGSRGETVWEDHATGFDGYTSTDLENWDGPFTLFEKPDDFAEDIHYWAPEIHEYKGEFYIFATTASSSTDRKRGTWIFKSTSDSPLGPYAVHSNGKVTPVEWNSLDGTLYIAKNGKPYMVFSHEWVDVADGQICALELSDDLTHAIGQPWTLFSASDGAPIVKPGSNPSIPGDIYVTDGPFMVRRSEDELIMIWSSFGDGGYNQLIARSDNGDITGKWTVDQTPLYENDGGHGMIFTTLTGEKKLVLHQPNKHPMERPTFLDINI